MSDYDDYLDEKISSMSTHAKDEGHCREFRDQCTRAVSELEQERDRRS